MGTVLIYAGGAGLLAGLISLSPLRRTFMIRSRRPAAFLLAAGLVSVIGGAILPARVMRGKADHSGIDSIIPEYQFHEVHSTRVHAPPGRVFDAVRMVTPGEISFFQILTWLRAPRLRRGEASILAPSPDIPVLETATRSGFVILEEKPGQEIVFGTLLGPPLDPGTPEAAEELRKAFAEFARPGYAKVAMSFHLQEEAHGTTLLRTETRVFATSPAACRRFAVYWRVIYPGSALIRYMWLRAIRLRAEKGSGAVSWVPNAQVM